MLQGMNPFYENVRELTPAFEELANVHAPVDETFIDQHKTAIETMREAFKEKGGIHMITSGDRVIICRAPSREIISKLVNGKEKLTLRFDCKPCEMHVVGKMKKSVMNQRERDMAEATAVPMTFYRTRPAAAASRS